MPLFRNLDESADMQAVESLDENYEVEGEGIADMGALLEAAIVERVSMMNDEERKAYLNSEEFQRLEEANVVGRRSIVRMTKYDDLNRRVHLASLHKAREQGDADWEMLRKNRIKERQLLQRIYKKYANQVRRDAIKSQKRLIKLSPRAFDVTRQVR